MTSPTVRLDAFPPSLARLILCGGEGLAAGGGELHDGVRFWLWDARHKQAVQFSRDLGGAGEVLGCPERWSLPLDPASPWSSRLAIVATWMLGWRPVCGGSIVLGERGVNLGACTISADGLPTEVAHLWWTRRTGVPWWRQVVADGSGWRLDDVPVSDVPALPTLPTHLQAHLPEVALILALYDVPEIRARVETP